MRYFTLTLKFVSYNLVMIVHKLPLSRICAPQICNPISIPNISPPPLPLPNPPYIGPSTFSSLQNIKVTKNVNLPQVFSYILLVQPIYYIYIHPYSYIYLYYYISIYLSFIYLFIIYLLYNLSIIYLFA